jgi:hypothetical protein
MANFPDKLRGASLADVCLFQLPHFNPNRLVRLVKENPSIYNNRILIAHGWQGRPTDDYRHIHPWVGLAIRGILL